MDAIDLVVEGSAKAAMVLIERGQAPRLARQTPEVRAELLGSHLKAEIKARIPTMLKEWDELLDSAMGRNQEFLRTFIGAQCMEVALAAVRFAEQEA